MIAQGSTTFLCLTYKQLINNCIIKLLIIKLYRKIQTFSSLKVEKIIRCTTKCSVSKFCLKENVVQIEKVALLRRILVFAFS